MAWRAQCSALKLAKFQTDGLCRVHRKTLLLGNVTWDKSILRVIRARPFSPTAHMIGHHSTQTNGSGQWMGRVVVSWIFLLRPARISSFSFIQCLSLRNQTLALLATHCEARLSSCGPRGPRLPPCGAPAPARQEAHPSHPSAQARRASRGPVLIPHPHPGMCRKSRRMVGWPLGPRRAGRWPRSPPPNPSPPRRRPSPPVGALPAPAPRPGRLHQRRLHCRRSSGAGWP